jgi:hypothetical protein
MHDKLRAATTPSMVKMQSQPATGKAQVGMEWDSVIFNDSNRLLRPNEDEGC